MKIILLLEKDGKEIRKELTTKMFGSLFDLQFMIEDIWDTIELNKMTEDVTEFFKIINEVHDCINDGVMLKFDYENNKFVEIPDKHYMYKKPEWKDKQ